MPRQPDVEVVIRLKKSQYSSLYTVFFSRKFYTCQIFVSMSMQSPNHIVDTQPVKRFKR